MTLSIPSGFMNQEETTCSNDVLQIALEKITEILKSHNNTDRPWDNSR